MNYSTTLAALAQELDNGDLAALDEMTRRIQDEIASIQTDDVLEAMSCNSDAPA